MKNDLWVEEAESGSGAAPSVRATARDSKLKPRRGNPRPQVRASQRIRLRLAMIELVDERGYDGVTVRRLARSAGVSTRTFYEQFPNTEACFIDTYSDLMDRVTQIVVAGFESRESWPDRVRTVLDRLTGEVAAEPIAARFILVAGPAAGPDALKRMRRSWQRLGAAMGASLDRLAGSDAVSSLMLQGIIAGVARVIRKRLLEGREGELPEVAGELAEWVLSIPDALAADLERESERWAQEQLTDTGPSDDGDRNATRIGDERGMILAAAAQLGADEGYEKLSIPRIRNAAGVSRRSFDAQFDGVKECFLAALELRVHGALAGVKRQSGTERTWPRSIRQMVTAICAHIAGDPERARAVFFQPFATGVDGVRWREGVISKICDYVRRQAPPDQRPSEVAAEASTAAVWAILHDHLATGRTVRLSLAAPLLSYLMLAPAIGARAAVAEIGAVDFSRG